MIIWEEYRWVIVLTIAIIVFIILDEVAYTGWKRANPGALYSHLFDKNELPVLDPSRPPTIYYE